MGTLVYRRLIFAWITLLIHVQVLLCQATPAPAFLEEPADQEVNPGDDVILKCKLNQPGTTMWLKDGKIQSVQPGSAYSPIGEADNDHAVKIERVSVDRDDGLWECQALVPNREGFGSRRAHLVVRQPPRERPTFELGGVPQRNSEDVVVRADTNTTVVCTARDSNPPATVKWWVGTKEITDSARTINQSGSAKLYNSVSTLTYQFLPEDNSGQLKCEIIHPALAQSMNTYVHLTVQYAPIVTIMQDPPGDVLEGGEVILSCFANANPPATTKWVQNGVDMNMMNASSIQLNGVSHASNGNYTCLATNDGFEPVRLVYGLSVRYPPVFTTHPHSESVNMPHTSTLFCEAEGNPTPHIEWYQNTTDGQTIKRSDERNLSIAVDYSSQGKYWCRASNIINDKENIVLSDVAQIVVKGPPKFETVGANPRVEITADKGSEAVLVATYCSNPPPTSTYWQREQRDKKPNDRILSTNKKYERADKDLARNGCYESRLKVLNLEVADSGKYKFWADNGVGPSSTSLQLNVRDASNTPLIVGLVVGLGGGALLLALIGIFCCYRMKKLCFAHGKSGSFDVEKRDVKQENGTTVIETTKTVSKDDNLKQNPLQTESIFIKADNKKSNGTANHVNMNGYTNGNDLQKKNGRADGMPAEVLHYAQLDVDGPMENGHGPMESPRMERTGPHDYADIRPTVL